MDETYTVSLWRAREGQELAFRDAFRGFADAATKLGGARDGLILQDTEDPGQFVVLRRWDGPDAVESWTSQQARGLGDAVAATASNTAAFVMKKVADLG